MPGINARINSHSNQIKAEYNLQSHSNTVRAHSAEQSRLPGGSDGAVSEKEAEQPVGVRRQQEERKQNQMEREEFDRHIIGHVERKDLDHVRQADQGAESCSARSKK